VSGTEKYVSVFDPNNYANPDTFVVNEDWWRWEYDQTAPERKHNFESYWALGSGKATVISPLPVKLSLEYVPQDNVVSIAADVRTACAYPGSGSWNRINQGEVLNGSYVPGEGEGEGEGEQQTPLSVTISYPPTIASPIQANPFTFSPEYPEAGAQACWSFGTSNQNLKGCTFSVSFTGWANTYWSENYTNVCDELGGSASFTLDRHLFKIYAGSGQNGTLVGAIGDEGNLYLAGTLNEFEDSIAESGSVQELYVKKPTPTGEETVALFSDTGDCLLKGLAHWNMSDYRGSCAGAMTYASSIDATDIKIPIADFTAFPPNPAVFDSFLVKIDDEIIFVHGSGPDYSSTDARDYLDVSRHYLGTTAAAHDGGAEVWLYGQSELSAAVTQSLTSLSVTNKLYFGGVDFLLERQLPIKVDDEYMLVTEVNGNVFTVQRGWNGSTAAAHEANAAVLLAPEFVYNEKYYLEHPAGKAFRIKNNQQETVAYIDDEGQMRLKGLVFENFTGWGLWDAM
jgi:hypothetical protein